MVPEDVPPRDKHGHPIQTKRIPIVKSYTSQVSQQTGLMQLCAVLSFALKRTSKICNKAIWCNHTLEFYTANTLVSMLIILWTSNTSNSAIHKTKTVIKWRPLLVNSMCVSMQLIGCRKGFLSQFCRR